MSSTRAFSFFRAGGFDQVRFETGQHFVNLDQLDWKLWVALACPTKGLHFDHRTLEFIDHDHDGRIRAPDLIAAVKWAAALLNDPDDFLKGLVELPLSAINVSVEEGKRVHDAAKTVLAGLGKPDASSISVADSEAAVKAFQGMAFNGDGIISPESAHTPAQRQVLLDVLDTVGGSIDKSGKLGVTAEQVKAFFDAVYQYVTWLTRSEADFTLMPLKGDTVLAFEKMKAVRIKIDDYFARCQLVAFDGRAALALNREEKEYLALAAKDLTITAEEIKVFPLARIEANKPLSLSGSVNPAWAEALTAFNLHTLRPLLGERAVLTQSDWEEVTRKLAPFETWQLSKVGVVVEKLGVERLKTLHQESARTSLDELFIEEKAQESTANSIDSVEKLVRYTRDLFRLANNFVNFKDFYERRRPAIFQVGTLFLDQRECELTLRVEDPAKHATLAQLSRAYLAYCDCSRLAAGEKMSIVAAFTNGTSDNLMVGRNGVFVDRDGKDWDATITKLVENPISVRAAFWSPYKKALRFVEEQVAKRASQAAAKSHTGMTSGVVAVGTTAAEAGKVPQEGRKFDVGVVAALGVAVGGITAAMGALLQAFFGLGRWMPIGILGLILIISGPSMLIAWLKLRQRNIGPLLDANGWAVNAPALLNIPFGRSLTRTARLPSGAKVDRRDPYEVKGLPWGLSLTVVFIVALVVLWRFGKFDAVLPRAITSEEVLHLGPDAGVPGDVK